MNPDNMSPQEAAMLANYQANAQKEAQREAESHNASEYMKTAIPVAQGYVSINDSMEAHKRIFRAIVFPLLLVIVIFKYESDFFAPMKPVSYWLMTDPMMIVTTPPWDTKEHLAGIYGDHGAIVIKDYWHLVSNPAEYWDKVPAKYWDRFIHHHRSKFFNLFYSEKGRI
ncbi:hypothetical protein V6259_12855 [Marinomonas sp. TI.3.20]|uniref:hypothetical protein n=1 Tax=Marinomonas sp. TI.3.20 TaxID=3121296 RepID=UPI00311F25A9